MKLTVFTADGSSSTEKDFPHFPEFDGEKGVAALRQVVIAQQANKRQGNASTKTRAEVSGTGKNYLDKKERYRSTRFSQSASPKTWCSTRDRRRLLTKDQSKDAPASLTTCSIRACELRRTISNRRFRSGSTQNKDFQLGTQ